MNVKGCMFNKILENSYVWDLSRYALDLTCGLYNKRNSYLKSLDIIKDDTSVLDIGCGTGLFADVTDGYYVGIDLDYQRIRRAKQKKFKKKKYFQCIDLCTLAKEKRKFDIVLIADVLHHLNDKESIDLLKTSARITNKYLMSFEPVLYEKRNVLEKWLEIVDGGNYCRYLKEFNSLFTSSGYKIKKNADITMGFLTTHFTICSC